MGNYPIRRNRRLRQSAGIRELVVETVLQVNDLIYPLFVIEESGVRREVGSMPGVYQLSLDYLAEEIREISALGIRSVLLFGIPEHKDRVGSEAYAEDGIIQQAIRKIKQVNPEMVVIADTCLCEYTDHGHCGVLNGEDVDNDASLALFAKIAVAQAEAGADIIAPSNMMDGFVQVIRKALDDAHFLHIPIMSYAVKYRSALYGPFRDAAQSAPQFGDRKTYQMDFRNRKEAWREAETDIAEGADFLIVKPGIAYLDIIRDISEQTTLPIVAYQVSGEYAMIKAASERGWLDERAVVYEALMSMKRAGASMIITYFAKDMARLLQKGGE